MAQRLFSTELPSNEWVQLKAEGFKKEACGVVYRLDRPAWLSANRRDPMTPRWNRPNGMPLGGIDTGCIDLEKNGTFGLMTIFNSHVPRRGPVDLPFLGISAGNKTWILADTDRFHASNIGWETVYYFAPEKEEGDQRSEWTQQDYINWVDWQVRGVDEIHYWGHYPIADLEYELSQYILETKPENDQAALSEPAKGLTSTGSTHYKRGDYVGLNRTTHKTAAPVSVGLRAWSPFLPGDIDASLLPGIVFEVHLRNTSEIVQEGSLAFTFPGPALEEAEGATSYPHLKVRGCFSGVDVTYGKDSGYALGVIGDQEVRIGGELGTNGQAWAQISRKLPPVIEGQPGASVAVDYRLQPGEERKVEFILTWYSPRWRGGGGLSAGGRAYTHMYSTRYESALHAAEILVEQRESLLKRVIAWQEEIYTEEKLPLWLRESLVNILHLLTEDGIWAAAKPPIGNWCRPEDGFFALLECARDCPDMEPLPDSFYGNIPLVYFFPQLALSTLRGFKAYQNPDGSIPFSFSRRPTIELVLDYPMQYQSSTNGLCYIDLFDRYWLCTGNDEALKEFYPSIKSNVIFTMNLNTGPDGVISAPAGNINQGDGHVPPFPPGKGLKFGGEHNGVFGMSSHLGGLHLAQLRIAERMAEKMCDEEFAAQCRQWIQQGMHSLETKMWNGSCYLNYWDQELDKKSEVVYAYQLVGEWIMHLHGLPGVFRPDRVKTTLKTIKDVNGSLSKFGAVMFADLTGNTAKAEEAFYGSYNMFVSETLLLSMTYMYSGEVDFGLARAHKHWDNIVCTHGFNWEHVNLLRAEADTGEPAYGSDYYQGMILWAFPAAIEGVNMIVPTQAGGLVNRVLKAAAGE